MAYPYEMCIRTNKEIDVQRTRLEGDLPITLAEAKIELKMTGIDDDDTIITRLISEAVDWAELFCGVSIVPQKVVAYLEVKNRMELPYGPVVSIDLINEVAPLDFSCFIPATGFVTLHGYGRYTIEYTTGYAVIPPSLLGALYGYICYAYEHRGDAFDEGSVEFAQVAINKAFPSSRNIGF